MNPHWLEVAITQQGVKKNQKNHKKPKTGEKGGKNHKKNIVDIISDVKLLAENDPGDKKN